MVVAVVVAVERDVEAVVDAVAVDDVVTVDIVDDAVDADDVAVVDAVVNVAIDVDAGEDAVVDTVVGIDEEEILFSNSFILISLSRIISVRLFNIFSISLNFP